MHIGSKLKIMCVCFLLFKNIFKDSRKEKIKHFKKITVSRQFSLREIGNFGTDQLRDMGRIQWLSFMRINYGHAGQRCLLLLTPANVAEVGHARINITDFRYY